MSAPQLEKLISARHRLAASLSASRRLSRSLSSSTSRLSALRNRLLSLPSPSPLLELVDRAAGPSTSLLLLLSSLDSFPLPDPTEHLHSHLNSLRRLENTLKFLRSNLDLALRWLHALLPHLPSSHPLAKLVYSLENSPDPFEHNAILVKALDDLSVEFRRRIMDNEFSLESIADLAAIVERMDVNCRLEKCVSDFLDVRILRIRERLGELDLGYLVISDYEEIEKNCGFLDVERWGFDLEFVVRKVFEPEFELCKRVFGKCSKEGAAEICFAEIAVNCGILRFVRFGRVVAETRKDPVKLMRLLDVFAVLSELRMDFNRLFGGEACAGIRNETRDLIKRVVDGVCEIFWELLVQVEGQKKCLPTIDATVPKLVSFIVEYCNMLLSDEYQQVLYNVMVIQRSWKKEKFKESILTDAILEIVKALETNIEVWSKGYEDTSFSYVFLMNCHCYFYKQLKGTKLGEKLGDTWFSDHEQFTEYYASMFLRESWGTLPAVLGRDGLIVFSGGKSMAKDLIKKRMKAFNVAFDVMYQKQLNLVISDRELRGKMLQLVGQAIVPVYRCYLQNYGSLLEQDASLSKYVKYTSQNIEKMLGSLFQHKQRSTSLKIRNSNGKLNGMVARLYHSASTVA